jgi:hypothetical protein
MEALKETQLCALKENTMGYDQLQGEPQEMYTNEKIYLLFIYEL